MLALVAVTAVTPAQAADVHADLRWGAAFRDRKDAIFTDRPYRGVSAARGGLALEVQGEDAVHVVDLELDLVGARGGPAFEGARAPDGAYIVGPSPFLRAGAGWAAGVRLGEGPLRLDLGARWGNRVETTTYDRGFTGVFGYLGTFGVGPWVRVAGGAEGGLHGSVTASVPLVSWVARSPWAANDDAFIRNVSSHAGLGSFGALVADGSVQGPGRLQALRTEAVARLPLGGPWCASGRVALELLRHTDPRPLSDVIGVVEVGLAYAP